MRRSISEDEVAFRGDEVRDRPMGMKCVGLALVALWLVQGTTVRAQYLPSPIGAARLPDPTPVNSQKPQPEDPRFKQLVPGPLTPEMAPPGPAADMNLTKNH